MMILRSSPASPFGRKVRIAASLLGLADKIDVRETDLNDPADSIREQNPVGKIPALILDDGEAYCDSPVILDYLDHLAGGGRIVPREPKARFAALRLQALCDGILDASLLLVYEGRYRPAEMKVQAWVDRQTDKVARGLAALEAAPPALTSPPDVGQITLACVLGYRDLRFGGTWRNDYPKLVAWLDKFAAQVPAFAATKVAA
ncbi:MAG TPA: glutathione S-transferase family protein [Pseudolabrys sp.]|nr:glutathione S-transferase family protein [Pseudolabrys sp.]